MVILSPHLDDAILSCWHLLAEPGDVRVINVFDGAPPAGTPPPWWDSMTGATDARERLLERRREDLAAMAAVGRSAEGLGLLDAQYRGTDPATSSLARLLRARLEPGATVFAPAAIGGHADHELVRAAAIELARTDVHLVLYADLPHAIRAGWPGWVSGEPAPRSVARRWTADLEQAGLVVERLVPRVRPLDADARAGKLESLECYGTQRLALDSLSFVPLEDPRALAYEVTWDVPRSALPSDGGAEPLRQPVVADAGGEPLDELA